MSEQNANKDPNADGKSDIEKLQAKNGEIIGKNTELKEANTLLSEKLSGLDETIKSLGLLVGLKDGEDITTKAQELIKAKEKETFDKMSENDKLSHRLNSIEELLATEKQGKEKAEKEALGLRIDDRLKNALGEHGVKDQAKLTAGLTLLKSSNTINGINGDNLSLDSGEVSVKDAVTTFLEGNKFLIDNPSKGGSDLKGGVVADSKKLDLKNSMQKKDFVGVISQLEQSKTS